jgi:hypothetical protein
VDSIRLDHDERQLLTSQGPRGAISQCSWGQACRFEKQRERDRASTLAPRSLSVKEAEAHTQLAYPAWPLLPPSASRHRLHKGVLHCLPLLIWQSCGCRRLLHVYLCWERRRLSAVHCLAAAYRGTGDPLTLLLATLLELPASQAEQAAP